MRRLPKGFFWRAGTGGHGGRPTIWTLVLLWLVLSTAVVYAISSGLESPGQTSFRGEVYGDLRVTGRITSHDNSTNSSIQLSNAEYPGSFGRSGLIHLRMSDVVNFTTYTQEDWDAPRYCQTHDSASGIVDIEIGIGSVYGYGLTADITYNISEFWGSGSDSELGQSEDYETFQSISGVSGTLRVPPGGDIGLTDATVTFDGSFVRIDSGGIIPSDRDWATLTITGSGRLDGGWSTEGLTMYDVHVDGKVTIHNLREAVGDGSVLRELVKVRGEDITIVTLEQPMTNSHWGTWLEPPWTIEVTTDAPGGVRMSNPVRATVFVLVMWVVAILLMYVVWSRKRSKEAGGERRPAPPVQGWSVPPGPPMPVPLWPSRAEAGAGSAVAGGVICILNCAACLVLVGLTSRGGSPIDGLCVVVGVIDPLIGLVGGTFAVLRQNYGFAVLGAVFTMASPGFVIAGPVCLPLPWAGVLALGLIFAGRKTFRSRARPVGSPEGMYGANGPW